jgi:hypothetical protein
VKRLTDPEPRAYTRGQKRVQAGMRDQLIRDLAAAGTRRLEQTRRGNR